MNFVKKNQLTKLTKLAQFNNLTLLSLLIVIHLSSIIQFNKVNTARKVDLFFLVIIYILSAFMNLY